MKFLKDILTEDLADGKYSSKKTVGIIGSLISFLLVLVDGFHFYTINESMFDSLLLFSASMLGISIFRKINFGPGKHEKQ